MLQYPRESGNWIWMEEILIHFTTNDKIEIKYDKFEYSAHVVKICKKMSIELVF